MVSPLKSVPFGCIPIFSGIIAMFSDDELMEMLVLKGGNAMALFYSEYSRASIDLDFSLCGNLERIRDSKAFDLV